MVGRAASRTPRAPRALPLPGPGSRYASFPPPASRSFGHGSKCLRGLLVGDTRERDEARRGQRSLFDRRVRIRSLSVPHAGRSVCGGRLASPGRLAAQLGLPGCILRSYVRLRPSVSAREEREMASGDIHHVSPGREGARRDDGDLLPVGRPHGASRRTRSSCSESGTCPASRPSQQG